MRPASFKLAAPVERVGVEQRRRPDQFAEQRVGLHLLGRPIRKVLFGAEFGQLQPAHLDVGLLKRLGDVDAVVDSGAIIVGADDDLAHPQLDQRLRVLDAPLAGAVGVGGGEDAKPSRRVDVLLALDDQQGRCSGYAARTVATVARLNSSGIPSGLPLDHCFVVSSNTSQRNRFFPDFVTYLVLVQA